MTLPEHEYNDVTLAVKVEHDSIIVVVYLGAGTERQEITLHTSRQGARELGRMLLDKAALLEERE